MQRTLKSQKEERVKSVNAYINASILQPPWAAKNNNKITDIETYYKKTFAKTANLFLAGLEALFTLSKENKNLYDFMKNYALAFQIKNDIDNFKTNSSDFKNGNYTLPVIYSSMENKSENLEKYIEKSYKEVEKITKIAINSLKEIENSIYKKTLIDLTNYSLGVNFE